MGLVRFIIFALLFYLIYFLIKFIFVKPFKEGMANGGNRKRPNPFKKKEGEVEIEFDPAKHQKEQNKVGEYIDYEEVKDQE